MDSIGSENVKKKKPAKLCRSSLPPSSIGVLPIPLIFGTGVCHTKIIKNGPNEIRWSKKYE